jgi:hypothetical protein
MKRSLIALFTLPIVFSCGTEDLTQPPGNSTAGTGTTNGGTPSAAGTPATTAGTPATSAGSSTGGSGSGTAGTPAAGGASAGTSTGGMAGTGTTGGMAGSGTSGSAGSGTSGTGGGGGVSIADIAGKLDGFLFIAPCGDGGTGYDCLNSTPIPAPQNSPACNNQQPKNTTIDFAIGGETGKIYDMTVHVYGVVEAKTYQGGTRRDGNNMNASAGGGDFWYTGGTAPNSTYNTYELHVTPKVDGAPNDYFLNARNSTGEGHESWGLNYTATFPVTGGGKLNFRIYDSNCRQIMNCGPGTGSSTCAAPRTIDLSAVEPKPANFTQPYVGGAPGGKATGQWVLIDVTAVVAK